MSAPQGILRVRQDGRTVSFQVEGQATVLQGLTLRRFAEQYLATDVTCLRVELRRCTWMDSTFVGTLLLLWRALERREQGEFVLVSPSPESRRLLRQMGIDKICSFRDEELSADGWADVEHSPQGEDEFRCNVLQAHQELAELPGPTGETFRQVVRCVNASKPGGTV